MGGGIRLSEKTKLAIKLLIKKHGGVTASQLSKLINLSRTRCNEYLKQMEKEGMLKSKVEGKKKKYITLNLRKGNPIFHCFYNSRRILD
ncbi:MAG: winged helix-turn-helix domain-containing protein [Candidatus Aenigmarchaeota archaeon]|nr:winged helix-turn-helix domain-containing protein [Candidatus Aenigmarchaeota archaeon]